jgi:hypothetical protein
VSDDLSDEERDRILAAAPDDQFAHFVATVCESGEVWLVRRAETEYGLLAGDGDTQTNVAAWPDPRFAELCQEAGTFTDYEVVSLELDEFIEGMLAALDRDGLGVAVLPMPDGRSVPVTARQLRAALYDGIDAVR